ncbi:MAG: hypothetical protein LBS34_00430 [Rickettsiales bacterium]|jgi:hypothetical protein|nr:hypothetical protein [Rickettsiales bacterium]
MKETKNVVCIKFGKDVYPPKYVNNLYHMVLRNTTYPINFYCFTEDPEGLEDGIIVKLLPIFSFGKSKYAYLKEAGLCDDNIGDLNGQRVLYFDLDVIIVDNIDGFFEIPKNDEFYIINDWNSFGNKVGQASCYSWVVGTLGFVKNYFEEHYEEIYKKFYTASQEYLSSKVIEKYGKLNFWPNSWSRSFRFHCLPTPIVPFLRRFKMAKIPKNAKIICFHGRPKLDDALVGKWKEEKMWKRFFYKHLKPVKWVDDYWK